MGTRLQFRWNDWNLEHATRHGVTVKESEAVVLQASRAGLRKIGDEKWIARGRGQAGRPIQVICLRDPDQAIYVIHARPLNSNEKRRYRR